MKMFWRQKKHNPLFVVIVTVEHRDSGYIDHCAIGPMYANDATDFALNAQDSVSREWGETFNELRVSVHFTPREVLLPHRAGEWTSDRVALLASSVEAIGTLVGGLRRWINDDDRDGPVVDGTPWERPPMPRYNPPTEGESSE